MLAHCSASYDLDAHLAITEAAEEREEWIDAYVEDAVHHILAGVHHDDLECDLLDAGAPTGNTRRPLSDLLDAAGMPNNVTTHADWQRLIQTAPLQTITHVVQAYREWCLSIWADNTQVRRLAEELAQRTADDAAIYLASEVYA